MRWRRGAEQPGRRLAIASLAVLAGAQAVVLVIIASAAERDDASPPAHAQAPVLAGAVASSSAGSTSPATEAARRFLDRYVDDDGRVVRRDQSGDTVSEGQAYALLVAVALGDRERFDRIWAWTQSNLQRPDGLLAWHWADGAVVDLEPAADADLDAAWALAVAAGRWGASYGQEAAAIVDGIVAAEVVDPGGDAFLAAGPWALPGADVVINPSYASPVAADVIAGALDAPGAATLASAVDGLVERTAALVEAGAVAPDWARAPVGGGGTFAAGPQGHGEDAAFGWDAIRVPLFLGSSCDGADQALAAAHWEPMANGAGARLMGEHPARLVGASAAAAAAGDVDAARNLLARAVDAEDGAGTYYGSALLALGRLLLETDVLGSCPLLAPPPPRS